MKMLSLLPKRKIEKDKIYKITFSKDRVIIVGARLLDKSIYPTKKIDKDFNFDSGSIPLYIHSENLIKCSLYIQKKYRKSKWWKFFKDIDNYLKSVGLDWDNANSLPVVY